MSLTRRSSGRPEQVPLRSGDVVLLYEEKNEGYVYSELSGSHNNSVCFYPVKPPYSKEDPGIPDINCSVFAVYLECEEEARKPIHFGQLIKLQHTASKHFIKPDSTKASWSGELGHIMVELQEDVDEPDEEKESLLFVILPQWGVRTTATEVHFNQPVRFESVALPSHFLHCSEGPYDSNFTVYADRYELNLSTVASHLMMVPHFQPEPTMHVGLQLRAGELLQLSERNTSSSLLALGSFVQATDVIEDVYLQDKYTDLGQSWFPASLWQLEEEQEPIGGFPLKFNANYRIKHVLTRKYLAVVRCEGGDKEEYKIILQDRSLDEWPECDTIFSVIPPSQQVDEVEDDVISDGEQILLRHTMTGLWLTVNHDETRALLSDTDAKLRALSLEKYAKDAFIVSYIPERLQSQLYDVAGTATVLKSSLVSRYCPINPDVLKALETMKDFGNKRSFLRHLQVIDLLLNLASGNDRGIYIRSAFKVFRGYAATDDLSDKNYLAPHFQFLWSQVGKGVSAEEVVLHMVENNISLVLRIEEPMVQDVFSQLAVSKDRRLLQLLGHLCVCSDMPIPSNQNYILNNFIKTDMGKALLYKTALLNGTLCIQTSGSSAFFMWEQCSPEEMRFLESQLLLFAKLCEGNNQMSISCLKKDQGEDGYVSFNEALAFAADSNLPQSVQSRYLHLIRVIFVEGHKASRAVFESTSWCLDTFRIYRERHLQERVPEDIVPNECFPRLKSKTLQLLKAHQVRFTGEHTQVLLEILRVINAMLKYGCVYTHGEVKRLIYMCLFLLYHSKSTDVRGELERWLSLVFRVQLKATAEEKAYIYQQSLALVPQRPRRTARSLSELNMFEDIKNTRAPRKVLFSYLLWMSLQTMQHDVQLLTTDKSVQEQNLIWKQYPTLQHYLRGAVNREDGRMAANILCGFAQKCIVKGLPHRRNQEIYHNFALEDVLSFVLNPNTALMQKTPGSYAEGCEVLLDACFIFLKSLAYKNFDVQKRIFTRMEQLLKVPCSIPAMTELLTEIFAGGSLEELPTEAHLQRIQAVHLQITEEHVERIFELICKGDGANELIFALHFLAKYEDMDLPIPRNQELLMRNFFETKESFCEGLLECSPEKKEHRMSLLRKKPTEHTTHSMEELTLLLNVTTFLASCAAGGNPSIRTKCHALFSMRELLGIVSDTKIAYANKTPFLQFLGSVYVDGGVLGKMDAEMFWEYLQNAAGVLDVAKRSIERERKEDVQKILLTHSTHYSSGRCSIHSSNIEGIRGILIYVLKGLLHLLKNFYHKTVFHPSMVKYMHKQPQVSTRICTALWDLSEVLMKIPLPRHYRDSLQVTVMAVTNSLFNAQILTHAMLPTEKMKCFISVCPPTLCGTGDIPTMEEYSKVFSREEKMNKAFRKYFKEELGQLRRASQTTGNLPAVEGPGFSDLLDLMASGRISVHTVCSVITERLLSEAPLKEWRVKPQLTNIAIKCLQTMRLYSESLKHVDGSDLKFNKFCEKLDTVLIVQVMNLAGLSDIEHLSKEALALLVSLMDSRDSPIVKRLMESVQSISDPHMQSAEARADSQKLQKALGHLMQSIDRSIQTAMTASAERAGIWKEVAQRSKENDNVRSSFEYHSRDSRRKIKNFFTPEVASPPANQQTTSETTPMDEAAEVVEIWIGMEGERNGESIPLVQLSEEDRQNEDNMQPGHSPEVPRETYPSPKEEGIHALIPSIDSLKLMLRLLGLMCDGQNQTLQNYMQKQPGQIESVNIVRDLQQLLKHFQKTHTAPENNDFLKLSLEDIEVLQLILQGLILLCVANADNQAEVVGKKADENIRWILALTLPSRGLEYPTELLHLKSTASVFVEVLTEEKEDEAKQLLHSKELQNTFPGALKNFHNALQSHSVSASGLRQRLVRGGTLNVSQDSAKNSLIRVYHSGLGRLWKTKGGEPGDRDTLDFCEENSRSIEVLYENKEGEKVLTTVTFPYDRADELCEPLKHSVKAQVDRSNPQNKLLDYLEWMDAAKRDVQWQRKMRHNVLGWSITLFSDLRLFLLLFVTFLLNLIMLVTYTVPEDRIPPEGTGEADLSLKNTTLAIAPDTKEWFTPDKPEGILFYILAGIHLALSLWMVVEYYAVKWPHLVVHGLLAALLPRVVWKSLIYLVKKTLPDDDLNRSLRIWLEETLTRENYQASFYEIDSIYRLVFLVSSVLSVVWYGYFYPICTFYIIFISEQLREVLKSITKHASSLLLVGALAVLALYTYSVASFVFLHEAFFLEDTPNLHCKSLWECFVTVSHTGLLSGLSAIPLISGEFREVLFRVVYDISFFIIVTTFGLNIIFGIMVDTFFELREKRLTAHRDSRDFCFICNIPSHEFDHKENHGFQRHITRDHGMWNYIYYYVYLDSLDPYNHIAVQSYVYRKIQSKQINFFPLYMAKCLGGVYTSSHLEQKVDELGQAMMKTLENRFQELNENMETLVRGPQERRPTLASTSPRPSISGVFPHRAAHGSLAAPPGIFIFDDPDSDPRSASLHRQSITALNQQVDTLTQHMNNLDKKLTTMLQRLQVAEVAPQSDQPS